MAIDWNSADRRAIGRAVENARLEKGWGKEEACRQAGLSPTTWGRIEQGLRVQDAKLAAALRVLDLGFTLPGTQAGEVVRIGGRAPDDDVDELTNAELTAKVAELERQLRRLAGDPVDENPENQGTTRRRGAAG